MIRFDSIQSRLTAVALATIIAASVAVGVVGVRLTSQFLSDRFHENFKLLASYMARNAELGVLLNDREMLRRLTQNMMEQAYVQGVQVLDASGKQIVGSLSNGPAVETRSVRMPILSLQMRNEGMILSETGKAQIVGHVVLTYSLAGLRQIERTMALRFLVIDGLLALMAMGAYWFMARSISAPLKNLVTVAGEVSRGRMDLRVLGGRYGETRTLARAFNEMLEALSRQREALEQAHNQMTRQKTLAEVGKFSMMVAHEVKNPLAIIRGSIDILKKKQCDGQTGDTLMGYLEDEVARINRLMEDFLVFAHPRKPLFAPLEANDMAEKLTRRMDLTAQAQGKQFSLHIEAQACQVFGDAQLIERAVMNLMRNALDVSRSGDVVEVQTHSDSGQWHLQVRDSGPGIRPEDLPRLFDPFFTTKAKGTGLGLAIAREIVAAHGGKIVAENRVGGGAVFEIALPLTRPPDDWQTSGENDLQSA